MLNRFLIFGVLFITSFIFANAQSKLPIVNGRLASIPKAVYPEIANDLCIGGKVKVLVEFMSKGGQSISAKAISGDELLYESAVNAVKQAQFSSMNDVDNFKDKGIVVLNFDSFVKKKCVEGGVLNGKAISLPTPSRPNNHIRIKEETEIKVRVLVELLEGKVISAYTVTGHPLLRGAFETAARKATFSPFYHGQGIFVKGVIIYKVKPDRTVSTKLPKPKVISCGQCASNPISLPKPTYSKSCRCSGDVSVKILFDENGNGE